MCDMQQFMGRYENIASRFQSKGDYLLLVVSLTFVDMDTCVQCLESDSLELGYSGTLMWKIACHHLYKDTTTNHRKPINSALPFMSSYLLRSAEARWHLWFVETMAQWTLKPHMHERNTPTLNPTHTLIPAAYSFPPPPVIDTSTTPPAWPSHLLPHSNPADTATD